LATSAMGGVFIGKEGDMPLKPPKYVDTVRKPIYWQYANLTDPDFEHKKPIFCGIMEERKLRRLAPTANLRPPVNGKVVLMCIHRTRSPPPSWRRGQRRRDEILRIVDWLCDKLASKLCALALDPVRVRPCDFPWDPYGAALRLFQYSPGSGNCVTTAMSILMFE
jgi:hypothetical protein